MTSMIERVNVYNDSTIRTVLNDYLGAENYNVNSGEKERICFGEIIASGVYTTVIKIDAINTPDYVFEKFNNPVMILTKDKYKKEIFRHVVGLDILEVDIEKERKKALRSWLEDNNFKSEEEAEEECCCFDWIDFAGDFDIFPFLDFIKSENEVEIFFMEELKNNIEVESDILEKACSFVYRDIGSRILRKYDTLEYTYDKEDLKEMILEYLEEVDKEKEFLNRIEDLLNMICIIYRDIVKVSEIVNERDSYTLDLHEYQFVETGEEIYCIDPFLIKEA